MTAAPLPRNRGPVPVRAERSELPARELVGWSVWIVWACAWFVGARAFALWAAGYGRLDPDTSLYSQGGIGLFPSPIGRALGAQGEDVLATVNALAGAAVVVLVALIAVELGGRAWLAAMIVAATPLGAWTLFVGVDTVTAALLLAAALAVLQRSSSTSCAFAALAVLTHPAALLIVLVGVVVLAPRWRLRAMLLVALGAIGALGALLTPYRSALDVDYGRFVVVAGLTALVALLPFVPAIARLLRLDLVGVLVLAALVGGAAAAGFMAGESDYTNARYMLPATLLMAAVAATPRPRAVT